MREVTVRITLKRMKKRKDRVRKNRSIALRVRMIGAEAKLTKARANSSLTSLRISNPTLTWE